MTSHIIYDVVNEFTTSLMRLRRLNSINDFANDLRRCKLNYDVANSFTYTVVILINAVAHVYVYQCACCTVTFVVLGIANIINISFLREGEWHFMEEFIESYFWKGYKYDEIISLLKKHHHVEISKRSFQR